MNEIPPASEQPAQLPQHRIRAIRFRAKAYRGIICYHDNYPVIILNSSDFSWDIICAFIQSIHNDTA